MCLLPVPAPIFFRPRPLCSPPNLLFPYSYCYHLNPPISASPCTFPKPLTFLLSFSMTGTLLSLICGMQPGVSPSDPSRFRREREPLLYWPDSTATTNKLTEPKDVFPLSGHLLDQNHDKRQDHKYVCSGTLFQSC